MAAVAEAADVAVAVLPEIGSEQEENERHFSCCDCLKEYLPDVGFTLTVVAGSVFLGYAYLGASGAAIAYKASGYTMMGTGSLAELSWRCLGGSQRKDLTEQVNALRSQIHGLERQTQRLESEVGEFEAQNKNLKSEVSKFKGQNQRLERVSAGLDRELADFREQNKVLTAAVGEEVEELRGVGKGLEGQLTKFAAEIKTSKKVIEKMIAANDNLGVLLAQLGKEQATVGRLLAQVEESQERDKQAELRIQELLRQMEEARGRESELEQRILKLFPPEEEVAV